MLRSIPFVGIPLLAATLFCFGLAAQPDGNDGDERKRRGPPQEALDACANLSEGDTCSFESQRGTMNGECRLSPQGQPPLACAPPRGGRRG